MKADLTANMEGKVLAVNISKGKGTKKKNVGACRLVKGWGMAEDGHAGNWHRQISLLSKKSIEKIREKGLPVDYGDFAENLSIEGIDLHHRDESPYCRDLWETLILWQWHRRRYRGSCAPHAHPWRRMHCSSWFPSRSKNTLTTSEKGIYVK